MALIKDIDELRAFVKINAATDFTTLSPYVQDAQDKYLIPYVGEGLLDELETKTGEDTLKTLLQRALGPFTLAIATDEMSINFGEAGHTVTRSDFVVPASDTKISRAAESQLDRGWSNLDRALDYLLENADSYPKWRGSGAYRRRNTILFADKESFQDDGMVDIDYSFLTFLSLRTLITRVEKSEALTLLPESVSFNTLRDSDMETDLRIVSALQAFAGSRVASIHTSHTTRRQRSKPGVQTEYKPILRPLYEDLEDTGNYFDDQANFWKAQLENLLISAGHTEDHRFIEFNSAERKIFVAGARRENSSL